MGFYLPGASEYFLLGTQGGRGRSLQILYTVTGLDASPASESHLQKADLSLTYLKSD